MTSVRKPVVADTFYSGNPDELKNQLNEFFSNVKTPNSSIGVISPHAGYAYSGQTAAWAIASLRSAKTFVILCPNHNSLGEQFSVSLQSWETPLGKVDVDTSVAKKLMARCDFLADDVSAHAMEHSIEVQLPFLQHRFDSFKIVPISIMNIDYSDDFLKRTEQLGSAIASLSREGVDIVASSDFSHYLPKQVAGKKDKLAVDKILELDTKGLFATLEKIDGSVCGFGPIAVLMSAAKALGLKGKLIHKSDSGDVTGDNKIVAYYAVGFE